MEGTPSKTLATATGAAAAAAVASTSKILPSSISSGLTREETERESQLQVEWDDTFRRIADYVTTPLDIPYDVLQTARTALFDSMACGLLGLQQPECRRLLGPVVPNITVQQGSRVPGTNWVVDPVTAAFNIGAMNRWIDYNDTWLAKEWGHPSDNYASILALADWLSQTSNPIGMNEVLVAGVQAYEIQGILALDNSLNAVGLDHVLFVKLASAAVCGKLLGFTKEQIMAVLSLVVVDNGALRTYRQAPNVGSRKSWAAGDAASRAVWLALMVNRGEMGYPTSLTAATYGFDHVVMKDQPLRIPDERKLSHYVMENILFKVIPAEYHMQTAIEAAQQLHEVAYPRVDAIDRIKVRTTSSSKRIIDKQGPLLNAADRDHCIQYGIAVALLKGDVTAEDYLDATAADPRIDQLRSRIECEEDAQFSQDYLSEEKRSCANAITIYFSDDSQLPEVQVEYPLGHRRRRLEGMPLIEQKIASCLQQSRLSDEQVKRLENLSLNQESLTKLTVDEFMLLWVPPQQ